MDAAASQVINLLNRITKELGYWFKSTKNVNDMETEMTRLITAAVTIEKQKEENDVKGIQSSADVLTWLEEIKKIKNEAEKIQTGMGCFNINKRYKAGKQSFEILDKINRHGLGSIPHYESTGGRILSKVPTNKPGASTSANNDATQNIPPYESTGVGEVPFKYQAGTADAGTQKTSFETRDVIFKKALECLEPKNSKTLMIALSGMGGVGKSHMMERLKKKVEDTGMLNWVVKVVVGQNNSLNALQNALAEQTGGALEETISYLRAERLKDRFVKMSKDGEKKILVILDDVWEELDLKDLGLPIPLTNSFKVLLTSRDANACTQMGVHTDSVFKIGPLNDDEAERLFFETVGLSKDDDPDHLKKNDEKTVGLLQSIRLEKRLYEGVVICLLPSKPSPVLLEVTY